MAVEDDDGLSRRQFLALTGVGAFAVGALTAEQDDGAEMLPTGGGGSEVDTDNFLTIPSASMVSVGGNEIRSVRGIDWRTDGVLTIESGGLIEIADTA